MAQSAADLVSAHLLPGWRAGDGTHVAALRIELHPGWKTYWRAPGDVGIPPSFDWRGSDNLRGVAVEWPTPRPISQGEGMMTIGYRDHVTLPLRVLPVDPSRPVHLSGRIEMGICRDVCVPVALKVAQDLSPDLSRRDPVIAAALAQRPYSAKEAGVGRVSCQVTPLRDGLGLLAEIDLKRMGRDEMAVIESDDPNLWIAPVQVHRNGGRLVLETRVQHVAGHAFALNRSGVRITVLSRGGAVDIRGCPGG